MALDVLKDLQDRVTALERQLGDQPGSDSLQPNVITMNADGTIGANLTGHLHAQGVDLDAGTTTSPPDADRIRWLRTSDGSVLADLFGRSIATDALILRSLAAVGKQADLQLVAQQTGSTILTLSRSVGGSVISIDAGAQHRTLLNDAGGSDFKPAWGIWTALSLNANWQNLAGSQACQYRVASDGDVQLRGFAQSKAAVALNFAASGDIAALPVGARPAIDQVLAVYGTDPTIGKTTWAIDAVPAGDLYVFAELTGRAPGLGAGVVVDLAATFSTL